MKLIAWKGKIVQPTMDRPIREEWYNYLDSLPSVGEVKIKLSDGEEVKDGENCRVEYQFLTPMPGGKSYWEAITKDQYDLVLFPEQRRLIFLPLEETATENDLPAGNKIFAIYKSMRDCPLKTFLFEWFDKYDPDPSP
jgi:hypothetical protein